MSGCSHPCQKTVHELIYVMIFLYSISFGTDDSRRFYIFHHDSCLSLHRLRNLYFCIFYASCDAPEKSGIIQNGNFWIPKMTLGFMMNPNEPHWGSSWTPMNPKVYGIHDFKKFSIVTFPDRKMNDFSRIPNCWHDRIETRRWRRSRDSDSFWSHFRIVSKHVLICISMWSFGT